MRNNKFTNPFLQDYKIPDDVKNMIDHILLMEGGYVNHPNDRGGPTNRGITIRTVAKMDINGDDFLDFDIDGNGTVTSSDIKLITPKMAINFYYLLYYKKPNLSQLPKELQLPIFDQCVNFGQYGGIKILQKSLKNIGYYDIAIDGIMGPQTVGSAQHLSKRFSTKITINNNLLERLNSYRRIVAMDSTQDVFLPGWINRTMKVWIY